MGKAKKTRKFAQVKRMLTSKAVKTYVKISISLLLYEPPCSMRIVYGLENLHMMSRFLSVMNLHLSFRLSPASRS